MKSPPTARSGHRKKGYLTISGDAGHFRGSGHLDSTSLDDAGGHADQVDA